MLLSSLNYIFTDMLCFTCSESRALATRPGWETGPRLGRNDVTVRIAGNTGNDAIFC